MNEPLEIIIVTFSWPGQNSLVLSQPEPVPVTLSRLIRAFDPFQDSVACWLQAEQKGYL